LEYKKTNTKDELVYTFKLNKLTDRVAILGEIFLARGGNKKGKR